MKGILLISHGRLAAGLYDSLTFFFGNTEGELDQTDYLCLGKNMGIQEFRKQLEEKIKKLNTGDGVLIFCDVLGGSPCSQALELLSDDVMMVTGMNLPMLMATMAARENVNPAELIETGRQGIVNAAEAFTDDEEEDFF